MLADGRGALFPPSWHDSDGGSLDGVVHPDHTLLALDPGADVTIDVQFLVLSDGPFSLRYQRVVGHGNAPSLLLAPGAAS